MRRTVACVSLVAMIAVAGVGCGESKPDANDPTNKVNVLKENGAGADATAPTAGTPGRGVVAGEPTTPPPPPK